MSAVAEIRPYKGGQITEPGIYSGVPLEDYHGNPDLLPGPSLSSSGARTIVYESPAKYWMHSPYNSNRVPVRDSDAPAHFRLGSAVHTLAAREEGFEERFAVEPERVWDDHKKNGRGELRGGYVDWGNGTSRACKVWKDERAAEGRTVISQKMADQIRGIAGALPWQSGLPDSGLANWRHRHAGLLEAGRELTIVWFDQENRIWRRARPDFLDISWQVAGDLKTSGTKIERTVWEHGYHVQEAVVRKGLLAVNGISLQAFYFLWVGVQEPFPVRTSEISAHVNPVTNESIDPIQLGHELDEFAAKMFSRCFSEGSWPAVYDHDADTQQFMPPWAVNRDQRFLAPGQTSDALAIASNDHGASDDDEE